jgi:choline transport protein
MGLVVFNNENYEPKAWHTSLTMWALIAILFVSNLWFRQVINALELFGGISHIIFFISSITTLVVLAHHSSPGFVFNTLTTGVSGWNNPGVCWGIGLLTLTYSMTGL